MLQPSGGEVVCVELEWLGNAQVTTTTTAGVLDRDAGVDYLIRGLVV